MDRAQARSPKARDWASESAVGSDHGLEKPSFRVHLSSQRVETVAKGACSPHDVARLFCVAHSYKADRE